MILAELSATRKLSHCSCLVDRPMESLVGVKRLLLTR
jgi:hypothetical protein